MEKSVEVFIFGDYMKRIKGLLKDDDIKSKCLVLDVMAMMLVLLLCCVQGVLIRVKWNWDIVFCERVVKRCIKRGKNSEKVCSFSLLSARQIGIWHYKSISISYLSSISM